MAAARWQVRAVQSGAVGAAVGDCLQLDTSTVAADVHLPPISRFNGGKCIMLAAVPPTNTNGINTIPAGTDTVAGVPASGNPGFSSPMYAVVLVSDGKGNWNVETSPG